MTYQIHIRHYRSSNNDAKLWVYSLILVSSVFLNTLGIIFYSYSAVLTLANILFSFIFLGLAIIHFLKRYIVPFVEIFDGTLNYWDSEKNEMVAVYAKDITHISSKLCELKLHTPEQIHSVNLKMIRNQKTRWEIKEKIREMASS